MIRQLILAMFFTSLCISGENDLRTDTYIGTAVDLKSGVLLYTEKHEAMYDGDKHLRSKVTYYDTAKNVIAEKQIEMNGSSIATYRLEDFRYGTIEGAEPTADGVEVFSRPRTGEEMKTELLVIPMPTATDAGLNVLVRDFWDTLQKNEEVDFHLGVPSQLDYYHFRVMKDREEKYNERPSMVVRFESEHWYLRLFLDPVMVWYDKETRRAVKYEGISNMYNGKGKSYIVRVTFDKPGP